MKTSMHVAVLAMLCAPGAIRQGQAQSRPDGVWNPESADGGAGDGEGTRATVSTGLAIALADYETHGVAFPIRVGADLPLLRTGPVRHRLLLAAEYAHFSRSFIREPEVVPGLQLDVASLRGAWRVFLFPRRGLHLDAGAGLSLLHDRVRVALPDRRVRSSETRLGLPLAVGLGWTVGRHVDLGLRYSQDVIVLGGSRSVLGQLELALGARL